MLFRQIHGQEKVKASLLTLLRSGKLPHAMLFLGKEGSGDLALALALATHLLCEQPGEEDACGTCKACTKMARLIHPDLHFSFPTTGGAGARSDEHLPRWREALLANPFLELEGWVRALESEGKQLNITADECNRIIEKLTRSSFEADRKVLIMWLPEYLGAQGNRLLKIIEEPPDETVLVFVARDADQILPTILSRCQIIHVPPFSDEAISAALTERLGIDRGKALQIAHLVEGNMTRALELGGDPDFGFTEELVNWLRRCYVGNGLEIMQSVEALADMNREAQKQFFDYGLHFLREIQVLKSVGAGARPRLMPHELKPAENLARLLDFEQIQSMTELFSDSAYYIERNANQKLLFLDVSLQIHRLMRHQPVGIAAQGR